MVAPTRTRRQPLLSDLALRESSGRRVGRGSRSWVRWTVAAAAVVTTVGVLVIAGVGREPVFRTTGIAQLAEFAGAAAHPRVDAEFLRLTATATATTLAYAILGTILSLAIGFVGGVLSSQAWWLTATRGRRARWGRGGWLTTRTALAVPRGIHEAVWGLLLLSVFGIQPIVAVLAIGIPFGAVTAKVFSEILDDTPRRPYTALLTAGASRPAATVYGLLPPAVSELFSYGFYRFECAIRSAAILGLIGAGGIGFQLQLSFQALRYDEIWTLLYALLLLCAGADLWSSAVRSRRTAAASRRGVPRRNRFVLGSMAAVAALVPLSVWWIGLDVTVLWDARTRSLATDLAADAWPPHLGDVSEVLAAVGITLGMSIVAIVVAFTGATALVFPAANLSWQERRPGVGRGRRVARLVLLAVTRGVLIVLRAIPPPVWALVLLFVMYPGLLAGAFAIAVYTIGVLGRLMAEATENLDTRPLRALGASGAPTSHVFCYGVVPAAAPRFVAYGLYRWEVTIRETVVVGIVGAGGLGLVLSEQLVSFDYAGAFGILLILMLLTLAVDITSAGIRRCVR